MDTMFIDDGLSRLKVDLLHMLNASCTCLTKTPDAAFHNPHCTYRLILQFTLAIEDIQSERKNKPDVI